ncbi:DUF4263 domain-containing protein [Methylomagnum ishizawai]|uniref:DUF4263 domain-containing protein n=1 Tax=Methylomagnum ishizawai TaxID=1760988 RepID=UPI001C32085E|nr:DUF4263 domain-containing protein [Methylomagnum ishizawai]BBL76060.1 hypothetical protein MishRS11D_31580 [Methylomagnum ishizawai]
MQSFEEFAFDPWQCRKELAGLAAKLNAPETFAHGPDILDWFRRHKHLSAFIGAYFPYLAQADRLAFDYDLLGVSLCDIAIGDSVAGEFCFVALGTGGGEDWAEQFDRGCGRMIDWFWRLAETRGSNQSLRRFGPHYSGFQGLFIAGLETRLDPDQIKRLHWRREHLLADDKPLHCVTYDELYQHLAAKLRLYEAAYHADQKHLSTRASLL